MRLILFAFLFLTMSCVKVTDGKLVKNVDEFKNAVKEISPGDKIILANGIWKDAELELVANGKEDSLIMIEAEENGKVFLEGQSHVKIGGSYIVLKGLVFRNGHTSSSCVISFRKNKTTPCNSCRVTECVIDNYNPPERFDSDYWVDIYGQNNRFDHNYLVGKRNRGVTLAVRLKNDGDRENNHRIDHNYFGYRPTLGSNGGETLRIGTSHYSLSNSNTIVEDNYFERCSGELEIISSKSCQNIFRNNTFYECQGTLTMRHGNETLVENNYFIGNRLPNTGGIRVINKTQTVKNNYLQGLTGTRFRGSLVVMNGVPDSPLNRYFQVTDSDISHNLLVDCDHVQLCAGSDAERSAPPVNSTMTSNIFYNEEKDDVFTVYDDIEGIDFRNNYISNNMLLPTNKGRVVTEGFEKKNLTFTSVNGIKKCNEYASVGPESRKEIPNETNTGVAWYPNKDYHIHFNTGKIITVRPGDNTLLEAIRETKDGDILELSSGIYHQSKAININHTITIKSTDNPTLTFERPSLFNIENGGSLTLEGLTIHGTECDDYSGNAVIRTSQYSMINNYKLMIRDCTFKDLDVNHSFNVLKVYKNTFADSILLANCIFENISGHVLNMDKEIDDTGIYNVENVIISDSKFKDIGGSALNLYRGGRDESTFGPILKMSDSQFENVGHDKRNKNDAAVVLSGVQLAEMENLKFKDSRKLKLHLIVGDPVIKLKDIDFDDCEMMTSNDNDYQKSNVNFKNTKKL